MFYCFSCNTQLSNGVCPNKNCAYHGIEQSQFAKSMPQYSYAGEANLHTHQETPKPIIPCNNSLQISFATVPYQTDVSMYQLSTALKQGTIFPVLDMPYNKKLINRGYTYRRTIYG